MTRKFSPLNPGPAEDRVIIMPCPMAPTDPSMLPFMKHRAIIKTLVIPDNIWYVDRARAEREDAARYGRPVPPRQLDYNAASAKAFGNVDGLPLLEPLCLALESIALSREAIVSWRRTVTSSLARCLIPWRS